MKKDGLFHAVITSDLHFKMNDRTPNPIIPQMSLVENLTDELMDAVLRMKPDAFIMLGDNTNSGNDKQSVLLKIKMNRLKEAGISVIPVPGNHDYDQCSPERFMEIYSPLLLDYTREPGGNGFVTEIGNTAFLAMDDSASGGRICGKFSAATLIWLENNLEDLQKRKKHIVFLSHHSVLSDREHIMQSHYCIQNRELLPLLKKYDVRICFSGHQHLPLMMRDGTLHEWISDMPVQTPHLITHLYMTDTHALIRSRPLRINNRRLDQRLNVSDSTQMNFLYDSFASAITEMPEPEKKGILKLYRKYLTARRNNLLPERKKEIQEDPFYSSLIGIKGSLGEMADLTLRYLQDDLVIQLSDLL